MKFLLRFIFLTAAVFRACQNAPVVSHAPVRNISRSLIGQIIKGVDSQDRPFYVRLIAKADNGLMRGTCGGTIVRARWILTSGHCVENFRGNWQKCNCFFKVSFLKHRVFCIN